MAARGTICRDRVGCALESRRKDAQSHRGAIHQSVRLDLAASLRFAPDTRVSVTDVAFFVVCVCPVEGKG